MSPCVFEQLHAFQLSHFKTWDGYSFFQGRLQGFQFRAGVEEEQECQSTLSEEQDKESGFLFGWNAEGEKNHPDGKQYYKDVNWIRWL